MQKTAEINIPELMKTAGENLANIRAMFEAQKLEAEKKGHDGTARVFRDLLVCVDQLQIIHFAVSMVHDDKSGNLTKPGTFAADLGNGFAGQLADALINEIKPGDTLQSFAGRVLFDKVETAHQFMVDGVAHPVDFDEAVRLVVDAGENPHKVLTAAIADACNEAERVEAESRLKSTEDFNHDARAFIGAAMGYQHAINLMQSTPFMIKQLEAYAQP